VFIRTFKLKYHTWVTKLITANTFNSAFGVTLILSSFLYVLGQHLRKTFSCKFIENAMIFSECHQLLRNMFVNFG